MTTDLSRRAALVAGLGMVAALCTSGVAVAGKSNIERTLTHEARKAGVPQECIGKMTSADAARIKRFSDNPRDSIARRNRKIREYVKKICRTR